VVGLGEGVAFLYVEVDVGDEELRHPLGCLKGVAGSVVDGDGTYLTESSSGQFFSGLDLRKGCVGVADIVFDEEPLVGLLS
jgi:hypothetical protein